MSLIKHRFFPRSMFDMDLWQHVPSNPSTLDLFDPFDLLDTSLSRNLLWIDRPDFLDAALSATPRVPRKYRVTLDCHGYAPKSIVTKISDDKKKLTVIGKEGEMKENTKMNDDEDYSVKEFRRSFKLPENVDTDKMASFVTSSGKMVIEFPIKEEPKSKNNPVQLLPKIVDGGDGSKRVKMDVSIPDGFNPDNVKVTCKDRDVIVQAENKVETEGDQSHVFYYSRSTLPENTDFGALKCMMDKNTLSIEAPLNMDFKTHKEIPIEKATTSNEK